MSRRDCLRQTILRYMNAGIKRQIVPGQFDGVIPPGASLDDLVMNRIREAEQKYQMRQFCEGMKSENPNQEFHDVLDKCLGLDEATNGRPRWYDERLPMKKPLIDRSDLRSRLYDMLEGDPVNTRLMTVRGEAPGKTYCSCLIKHVAGELDLEQPVVIDLLDIASVNSLAERLVDLLGLSHAQLRERFSTEVREGRYFNDWLVGQSRTFAANKRWLLVFDHLAKPGVPQDVANTVIDLALRAEDRSLTNIWIIILDSSDSDALIEADLPCDEVVRPIPKEAVTDFVGWLVELRRAAGDPNPQVPAAVDQALQEPFPLSKAQLKTLRRQIVQWMRSR